MSTLADVMKALREVIVMNERVVGLADAVQKLAAESVETRERLVRVETILDLATRSQFKALPDRGG